MSTVPRRILPVIVFSQFAGTSRWFAANAVMPDLQRSWGLPASAVGPLTSAVQFGFVAGTLVFALLMVADRFSPSRVFLGCALLSAAANALTVLLDGQWALLLALRFAITIVSIELFVGAAQTLPLATLLPWLAAGPALGLYMFQPLRRSRPGA